MGNQMESSIFVLDPIKGVFWPFKVDRRIYLTDTVLSKIVNDASYYEVRRFLSEALEHKTYTWFSYSI